MNQKKLWLSLTLIVILIAAYQFRDYFDVVQFELWIKQAGWYAPLLFITAYFVSTIVMFPVAIFTLISGALFGPYWGTLYSMIGAVCGAAVALLIARYLLQDWVEKRSNKMVKKVIDGVNQEGWQFVAFIRLVPLFPFVIVNYAFGLSNISLLSYTITNTIFMLPACFAYSYLGYLGKSAASDGTHALVTKVLIAVALFAISIMLAKLAKKYHDRKKLPK